MNRHRRQLRGFTLIELLVSLAVLAVLLAAAIPSFSAYRQRAVLRGAADQLAGIWGEARFEALRRNQMVKVVFLTNASGELCIGTALAASVSDDASCDCMAAACGISNFPAKADEGGQAEWRGVQAVGNPTIGDVDDSDFSGVVVLDPKRGNLAQAGDVGTVSLRSPPSGLDYRLNFTIDRNGRAYICEPTGATNKLPQFTDRRC